jgi:TonB-linked SusC/RagA family outer membrane protein
MLSSNGQAILLTRRAHEQHETMQQEGGLRGRVVDSARKAIAGATVAIQGTKQTAVTDDKGRFSILSIPAGEYLVTVKCFGFKQSLQHVVIHDDATKELEVVLVASPTMLSGVVTTATGVQQKITVGNDITTLNVDSIQQVAPVTSVTDLLESRVPGLTVLRSSGVPGDPARIRLRGASSINENNDPIVIVDGVRVYARQSDERNATLAPSRFGGSATQNATQGTGNYATPSPLDQIDPNNIETIEVFKGPSASAMYGPDAANGVIVITTKHGQAGPTHWDARLATGLSYEPGDWPVNYYRFGYGQSSTTGSPFCAWNDLSCVQDSIVKYQALNDQRYNVFADHGSHQSGALTVSGGDRVLRYSLTASGAGNLGILKMPGLEQQRFSSQYGYQMPKWMARPDRYNTLGGSGQLTVQPSTTATISLVSSLYTSTQQRSSLEQAPAQLEARYINPLLLGAGSLLMREYERATSENLTSTNALSINWAPVSWLPLSATGGLNTGQRVDKTYIPYGIILNTDILNGIDSTGFYGLGRGTTLDKTLTLGTIIPLRAISLGIGMNYHAGSTNDFSAYTDQLTPGVSNPSTFPPISGNNPIDQVQQSSLDEATYGWYIEPRLNFASRFFVSPGFRLDGGSATGANSGLTGFPKIDLSYVMIDRPDRPLWGLVSLFRPRLAFGVAGVQPGPADKLRLFGGQRGGASDVETAINLNGTLVPAAFLSAVGNTHLQPETSRELEGGFETDLWSNRLELTYTHYDKRRHNAILSVPVAASVYGGNWSHNVNIGEISNTGTEITVDAQVLQGRAIGWHVGLNFSQNTNTLVRLNPGQNAVSLGSDVGRVVTRLVEGYPLWGRWALPIASYADVNQDGVIEASEVRYGDSLVYLGPQQPKSTMGISTDLTLFRGTLGMHASASYQGSFTQFNQAALSSATIAQLGNAPGTSLATQAAIIAASGASSKNSAIGMVQTVSALRLQDLSINYQVPVGISQRFHIPHMQVALQGSNLWLHTNYRGFDPNVNAFPTVKSSGETVVDTGQLPTPRTWSLQVSLRN